MRAPRVRSGRHLWPPIAAAALLTLAALLAACKSDSSPEGEPLPPLTPFDPALMERLHDIRDRAAEVRGLTVHNSIEEGWFDQVALEAYDQESLEFYLQEFPEQIEAWNITLRLMNLIEPEDDLLDIYSTGGSYIAGIYFPYLDKLALVYSGEELTPDNEITLAHEYVHSFQDSRWDIEELQTLIERDDDENSSSEFATTTSCLIEGDATLSEVLYAEEVYGPDWLFDIYGDVEEAPEPEPDEELPEALQRYFSFNYNECFLFVAAIYNWGGLEAVDDLYDDVPRSTEAILHPDRYLEDKDIGSLVPLPDLHEELEGWERLSLLPFGEFDIFVYIASILGDESIASTASTGWDGGRSAVYTLETEEGNQQSLLHVGLAFDTEADRQEFLRAFEDVLAIIAAFQETNENVIRWSEEAASGVAWWDVERFQRFDMLIGDDEGALKAAAAAAGAPQ